MVQLTPLLRVIPLFSDAHNARAVGLNGLAVRQTFNPNVLPTQCQSPCQVISTLMNCGSDTTCFCTSLIGNEVQQCMNCLVQAMPSIQPEAQHSITAWNEACNGDLSLSGATGGSSSGSSGGSSGGSNPLGANSSGAAGFAAYSSAVCIVAALAGAYATL